MASIDIGGITVPEAALTWKFVRASGPGGQNVNKVSTAVECRLDLDVAGIRGGLRERLERLAGSRLTAAGEIIVFVDTHRTQPRNRDAARERLAALIEQALPRAPPARPHTTDRRRAGRDGRKTRSAEARPRSGAARSPTPKIDEYFAGKPAGEIFIDFDPVLLIRCGPRHDRNLQLEFRVRNRRPSAETGIALGLPFRRSRHPHQPDHHAR